MNFNRSLMIQCRHRDHMDHIQDTSSSVVTVHVRRCLVQAEIEAALAIRFAVCNVSGLIIVVIVGNA